MENYEQKYNEALKRMKSWTKGEHPECFSEAQKAAEFIFPELKESDDERIRLEIRNFIWGYPDKLPERDKWLAWLEKQGKEEYALKSFRDKDVHKFMQYIEKQAKVYEFNLPNRGYDIYAFAKDILIWLEKQDEKKPADKVEPKFHEGEWITNGDYTWKIVEITPLDYILQSQDGNIVDDTISYVDEHFHRWTIADAKDGDVLNSPSHRLIWIYKDNKHYHVCVNMNYATKNIATDGLIKIPSDACPATKDERTILFEKMKEEGYKWDTKKKEVKTIEQNPEDKVETKFKAGNWYQCTKDFFGKGVTFDKNTAYYCAKEGCLQNEYGCHIAIVKDLYDNFKLWTIEDAKDGDVLVSKDNRPFIFTGEFDVQDDNPTAYCGINSSDKFITGMGSHWTLKNGIKPATKEQSDLLFSKMKEAGYEWDSEKKELKKVEQGNHPRIVTADFTGGEGFYKLKLDNLNKEQVAAIEIMINNPKPGKKLDADKVIEWLKDTINERTENYGVYNETRLILPYNSIEDLINDFKEDFGL